MPGQASYQWGIITYLAWLALLVRMARREDPLHARGWSRATTVALTVVVPGFNEVMAPIVFATIVAIVVLNCRRPFEDHRFMLMLLGLAIFLTAVSLLAPGNSNRSDVYPDLPSRHNLAFALAETGRQTMRFLARYGTSPVLWLGAIAAGWWAVRVLPPALESARRPRYSAMLLSVLLVTGFFTLFPIYWEYGNSNQSGEGRTHNVTYVALCASAVSAAAFLLAVGAHRFASLVAWLTARRAIADLVIATALAAALMTSPATRRVIDALEVAPRYARSERSRAEILRNAPAQGIVSVNPISTRPAGLFWGDLEPDAAHWINQCVADYYGLEAVQAR
jgi:hypothetical protein